MMPGNKQPTKTNRERSKRYLENAVRTDSRLQYYAVIEALVGIGWALLAIANEIKTLSDQFKAKPPQPPDAEDGE